MNILHMKYAIEVARSGSINKAAENLYMNQPNLSRAIKELENSLGITIFSRTTKGMIVTPDGEVFLGYAKKILSQLDEVENIFQNRTATKQRFSISVPRASYISEAFTDFTLSLKDKDDIEIFYKETNSYRTLKNVSESDYKLGILRYKNSFDKYYTEMLKSKDISYELINRFHYVLVMSKDSKLARCNTIKFSDLSDYIEIAHADPFVPSLSFAEVKKEELSDNTNKHIFVFERGSQFSLLERNTQTFMWISPVDQKLLDKYNLVQRECSENKNMYYDVFIHKNDYKLTDIDKEFLNKLYDEINRIFN